MFTNLNKEPKCPKTSCDDYCKIQLRNVSVSNMLPCCVQLMNGKSVCQCVIAFPDSNNNLTQCPPPNLKLVSNQIFNMSGISRFFSIKVPVCGTIHFSYNIYKGIGPKINTTAEPFLEPNVSYYFIETVIIVNNKVLYFYNSCSSNQDSRLTQAIPRMAGLFTFMLNSSQHAGFYLTLFLMTYLFVKSVTKNCLM